MHFTTKKFFSILFVLALFGPFITYAQTPGYKFQFIKAEVFELIECYKDDVCSKITIPDEYEAACLLALAYYPELKNEHIEFVYGKGAYSMAARPVPMSLFKSRKKRKYRIFINTESKNKGLLLNQVGFNAQVGIVGHELAHILYYSQKSSARIILDGILYSNKKFRAKFEKDTDKVAIDRGLGWQLHDFSNCTQTHEAVPEEYKIYKKAVYMCPQTIEEYIEKNKLQRVD
jgi:hypothetical protein